MQDQANLPKWLYNEFQYSGVDYSDIEVARNFEKRHRSFRDFDKEFRQISERVGLKSSDVVLDLGCGSGAFVVPAAKFCRKVYAADVSKSMLGLLQEKLADQKLANVETFVAGFLTYRHQGEPLDVIVSSIALHHLPDYWKAVALKRIADVLKPGGVFYLLDVIFNFPISDWQNGTQRLLDEMSAAAGHEANAHIASEYSSFNWIVEGIFERVGLKVEQVFDDSGFLRAYVCRKIAATTESTANSRVLSCAQARAIDAQSAEKWGIPTLLLMENAGRSLAEIFLANATRLNNDRKPRRVLICCGKGNNGGDGFVLARRLELQGIECRTIAFGKPDAYKGDALTNLSILKRMCENSPEKLLFLDATPDSIARLHAELSWCDWVVDALLGTGGTGALRSPYDVVIPTINQSGKPIYAVDVPSGLNADTGLTQGDAIRARITTSLAAAKLGLMLDCAKEFVGELHVGDIGIPIDSFIN